MAEAVAKQEMKRRGIRWYRVASAGISASDGNTMSESSMQVMNEAHIPYTSAFAARKLTRAMLEEAFAVICMTEEQRCALGDLPNATSFYALCGREIPDPYGKGVEAYRVTLRLIRECMPRILEVCCPPLGGKKED